MITGAAQGLTPWYVGAVFVATDGAAEVARGSFLLELEFEDATPLPLCEPESVAGRARFVHTVFPYTSMAVLIKPRSKKQSSRSSKTRMATISKVDTQSTSLFVIVHCILQCTEK